MSLAVLLTLFGFGLIVGFASGLVGIGGGVLIVPFLYFFYAHPAWSGPVPPLELQTVVANATSLFVVIPTAIWGTRSFARAGLVNWQVALPIAVAAAFSAVAGVRLALLLPGEIVRISFGCFLLATAAQLLWRPHTPDRGARNLGVASTLIIGAVVGILSGLLGIGGGAVASALLIYFARLNLREAAATAMAVVACTGVVGAAAYGLGGWRVGGMPPWSIGFIHVAAALPILTGSVIAVKWGTQANQRMDRRVLRGVFCAFFSLLGLYLIVQSIAAFATAEA